MNSIGIELNLIPAGTFTMGHVGGAPYEMPHEVTLTKPFYIGVYEVTNAQWQRVMGSVPSYWKDADRPVEQVSWDDANEFCRRLSALPEEKQAGRVYRLPTEAEWEYACRAGTTTQWSFGDDESRAGDYAWFAGNSDGKTHPVGTKNPNAWGLFDMHGNVHEWCSDWHGDYAKGAVTDPQGPSEGSDRVLRGGCWGYTAGDCRSANRYWDDPSDRYLHLGFRLALSPSEAEQEPPEAAAPMPAPVVGSPQDRAPAGLSPADARALQEQKAEALGLELEITNSIGIKLIAIPPGTFTMGPAHPNMPGFPGDPALPGGPPGYAEAMPHEVTLTKPFYLGVYEVTKTHWNQVMKNWPPSRSENADRPVEQVNWDDANEFCRRLSALRKEKQAGRVYRLPTEAEWEYACRAGTTTKWSFGDDESKLGEYAWFAGNSDGKTHPVGTKNPNAWGLFDMHGNVREMVHDPQGPSHRFGERVRRGGGWHDTAGRCRSAFRLWDAPSHRYDSLGFRLALSPSGADPVPPEAAAGD